MAQYSSLVKKNNAFFVVEKLVVLFLSLSEKEPTISSLKTLSTI